MTVSFQSPQIQYTQAVSQAQPAVQPQGSNSQLQNPEQNMQYTCACQAYAQNPYLCAFTPTSPMVVPQGMVQMPNTIPENLKVQANQELPAPSPNVNYNQITPYLNGNSNVFQPSIQTQSGQAIATASTISQPLKAQEAQLVYQGPIKTVNPQITPIEQYDNEINKQYQDYFLQKAQVNKEMRKALKNSLGIEEKKPTLWEKLAKLAGVLLVSTIIFRYRKKIPVIKRFFK